MTDSDQPTPQPAHGRKVMRFESFEEFERKVLAGVKLSPTTPDDVTRFKLDGPPATPEEIAATFGQQPAEESARDQIPG